MKGEIYKYIDIVFSLFSFLSKILFFLNFQPGGGGGNPPHLNCIHLLPIGFAA